LIEYIVISFQNFSLSFNNGSPDLLLYFFLGGSIVASFGYWMKKWAGVILGLLGVLLLYLYVTGFFRRIFY